MRRAAAHAPRLSTLPHRAGRPSSARASTTVTLSRAMPSPLDSPALPSLVLASPGGSAKANTAPEGRGAARHDARRGWRRPGNAAGAVTGPLRLRECSARNCGPAPARARWPALGCVLQLAESDIIAPTGAKTPCRCRGDEACWVQQQNKGGELEGERKYMFFRSMFRIKVKEVNTSNTLRPSGGGTWPTVTTRLNVCCIVILVRC